MRFLRKNHSRIWTCCSWRNVFEMLPEWANLISSYSLSDNLDWSPSPLCRWTEPETNGTFPLLLLLTNIVVKKGGPNFHGSFSFSNWADAKWALAASRTNLRKLDPWTTSFTYQAIPILEPVETPKWSFGSCAKKSRMQRNFASDGGWEGQRLLCRCQGRYLHIWKPPVIKRWST